MGHSQLPRHGRPFLNECAPTAAGHELMGAVPSCNCSRATLFVIQTQTNPAPLASAALLAQRPGPALEACFEGRRANQCDVIRCFRKQGASRAQPRVTRH